MELALGDLMFDINLLSKPGIQSNRSEKVDTVLEEKKQFPSMRAIRSSPEGMANLEMSTLKLSPYQEALGFNSLIQ